MRAARVKPIAMMPFLYPHTWRCCYSAQATKGHHVESSSIPMPAVSKEMEAVIAERQAQKLPIKRQTPARSTHEGTMTLGERERFSKIFETILSTKASPSLPKDETTFSFHPDPVKQVSERSATNSHVEASEQAAREHLKAYPPVLRQEAEQAMTNLKQRKLARQRQLKSSALRSAPLYKALKEQLLECTDSILLEDFVHEHIFGPLRRNEIDLADKAKRKSSMAFCNAYPLILADAMRIYRLSYNDPAAAIDLFDRVKAHGITSIVIGANTLVYNEVLAARWEGWRDIESLLVTLEEMEQNGVRWDDGTANILKKVSHDILTETRATGGAGLYWQSEDPVKLESFNRIRSSIVLENTERTIEKLREVKIEE